MDVQTLKTLLSAIAPSPITQWVVLAVVAVYLGLVSLAGLLSVLHSEASRRADAYRVLALLLLRRKANDPSDSLTTTPSAPTTPPARRRDRARLSEDSSRLNPRHRHRAGARE